MENGRAEAGGRPVSQVTPDRCVLVTTGRLGVRVDDSSPITFGPQATCDKVLAYLAGQDKGSVVHRDRIAKAVGISDVSQAVSKVNKKFKADPRIGFNMIRNNASRALAGRYELMIEVDWQKFERLALHARAAEDFGETCRLAMEAMAASGGEPFSACLDWPGTQDTTRRLDLLYETTAQLCSYIWETQADWTSICEHLGPLVESGARPELARVYLRALQATGEYRSAVELRDRLLLAEAGQFDPDRVAELRCAVAPETKTWSGTQGSPAPLPLDAAAPFGDADHVVEAHVKLRHALIMEDTGRWLSGCAQPTVRQLVADALGHAALSGHSSLIDYAAWVALTTVEARDATPLRELLECRTALEDAGLGPPETALVRAVAQVHRLFRGCSPDVAQDVRQSVERIAAEAHEAHCEGAITSRKLVRILYAQVIVNHENTNLRHRWDIALQRVRLARAANDAGMQYHAVRHLIPLLFAVGSAAEAIEAIDTLDEHSGSDSHAAAEVLALRNAVAHAAGDLSAEAHLTELASLSQDAERHLAVLTLAYWWEAGLESDRKGFPDWLILLMDDALHTVSGRGPTLELAFRAVRAFTEVRRFGPDQSPSPEEQASSDATARKHLLYVYEHRDFIPQVFGGLISAAGCIEVAYRLHEDQIALDLAELIADADDTILQAVSGAFIFGAVDRFLGFAAACAPNGLFQGRSARVHFENARRIEDKRGFSKLARMSVNAAALRRKRRRSATSLP